MTFAAQNNKSSQKNIENSRKELLAWYDDHPRDVPWRIKTKSKGRRQKPDPYKVWLSEVMCQQTTVQAVKPYYARFLEKWPTVHDLAAADEAAILSEWAGLGYYARARNLHKCAKIIVNDYKGVFPPSEAALKKLPGIGDYSAAAIMAIAFDQPAIVVDGNVERIMARFFAITEPLPKSKPFLKAKAAEFYDGFAERPGDLAQAFMDLGANICTPKTPRCGLCPLQKSCKAHKTGQASILPQKMAAKSKPLKFGYVYWIENDQGQVLFQKRAAKGLLGGMIGLPTGSWSASGAEPLALDFLKLPKPEKTANKHPVFHTFTHFDLALYPVKIIINGKTLKSLAHGYYWTDPDKELKKMPSVFKKAFITLSSL